MNFKVWHLEPHRSVIVLTARLIFGSVHSKIRYSTPSLHSPWSLISWKCGMCEERREMARPPVTLFPSPGALHTKPIQNPHFRNKFTNSLALYKYSDSCDLNAPLWHPGQCCLILVYDWLRLSFIFTPCSAPIGPAGNNSHLRLSFMIGQI